MWAQNNNFPIILDYSIQNQNITWWRGQDLNLRSRKATDLQSVGIGRSPTPPLRPPRWETIILSYPIYKLAALFQGKNTSTTMQPITSTRRF